MAVPWVRFGGGLDDLPQKKEEKKPHFAYDTVRSEQHGDFKLPFSWDEGDGTGEPRLLAGSSEASKASTSVEQNHKGSPRTAVGHSSEKSLRLRVVQHGGKDQKLFVKDTRRSARDLIPMSTSTE